MKAGATREGEGSKRRRARRAIRIAGLALGLNVLVWVAARVLPGAATKGTWPAASLLGAFLIGVLIGRGWASFVQLAFGVVHAVPVYPGLLPGCLSTWAEALWWASALAFLVALTGLGVISRGAIRWLGAKSPGPSSPEGDPGR